VATVAVVAMVAMVAMPVGLMAVDPVQWGERSVKK